MSVPRGGLGDAEGLEAEFAAGDLGEVAGCLLLGGAVAEDGAHGVHLGVAGGAVGAGGVDGFQDGGGGGEA